ncbi:MAG: hypothetical protein ACREIC_19390, partial [Limisphaerales bacterium]
MSADPKSSALQLTGERGESLALPEPELNVAIGWRFRFRCQPAAVLSAWTLVGILLLVIVWPLALQLASHLGPQATALAQH